MGWGRGLIIFLGLMQLSYVAQAREIETFTDSQGILHITNAGSKQQGSPENPPSPAAPLRPSSFSPESSCGLARRETCSRGTSPSFSA